MRQFSRIAQMCLALATLSVVVSPALAAGHYWREHEWHHYERRHSERWSRDRNSGPVHPFSEALPNRRLTPGALNPAVTQATIYSTICTRGYTRTIRPPERYTERLKRVLIREYGYHDRKLWHYELDHLLCRVAQLLRTRAALGNSRGEAGRDTRSVARTTGFSIRDSGGLA